MKNKTQCFHLILHGLRTPDYESGPVQKCWTMWCLSREKEVWLICRWVIENVASNSMRVTASHSAADSTHLPKPSLYFASLESCKNPSDAFRWTRLGAINVSLVGNFRGVNDRSHPFHPKLSHLVQSGLSSILSVHFQLLHTNNFATPPRTTDCSIIVCSSTFFCRL
jgi:hypothetical protein